MGTQVASDYLENILIDHIFRTRAFAKPAGLWLALFTTAPSDAGGGIEATGGSYARAPLAPLDANWQSTQGTSVGNSTGSAGATVNLVAIVFPAPTANWGTVTHFGIFDAAAAGNLLIWDALVNPRIIQAGDPAPSFPIGTLQISVA